MNFKQIDKPKSSQTSYSGVYYGASGSAPAQKIDYLELNEKQLSVSSGIVKRKVISEIGNIQSGDTAMYLFDDNAFIFVLTNSGTNESVGGFDSDGAFFSKKISLIDNNNDTITLNAVDGYLNVSGDTLNQIPTIQGKINGLNEQLLLNPDGGNIIIGQTTNTGQKLQVNGNIKSTGLLLSNAKGDYLIEGDYNGLKVNGNAIGAKIYKYSELNTYTFTDEDVSNSFNAYTIKKIINDKYNNTGGTIDGDVNITGNLTVNGSSITNITNTQVINALGYTPYNATNPNNYITANHSGNITATGFIKNGGTSSQFLKADGSVDSNTYTTPTYITTNYTSKLAGFAGAVPDIKDFDMTNGGLTANYGFFYAAHNAENKPNPDATWIQGIKFPKANNPDYSQLIVTDGDNVYYGSEGNNAWQDWKTFVMQNDNVNFSKITVNNVGKIYFDSYGGELALSTHSYGAYLDVSNTGNALHIRNANNSHSNIATFSDSVNTIGNTTLFGNGSSAKVSISDGGYIGVDSINDNDNLIVRAKGAGGLALNYGSIGSHIGFYDGTTQIGYINAGETYLNNKLVINDDAVIGGSLTTSKLFDTSRKKQYIFWNYTGGWVRIAKLSVPSTGEAVGTISIANTYGYSHSVSTVFSFGVTYRDIEPWVTQMGATNATLPKVRIVSPINDNTDYYIEVYYTAVGGPNTFYIQLSNEHNVELLNSFTNGEVPAGYVGREFIMNHYGISARSLMVGNNWGSGYNRIEVNDAGYLSLTTHENELSIGKTHASESLYINYRQPKTGNAPTTYIWNNGTSTEYANHRAGGYYGNSFRLHQNDNNIQADGSSGMRFDGSGYVYFAQVGDTYFLNQIIARGGITNDLGSYVSLKKQTYVDGHIEFKNKLQSLDTGILAGNTAFQIRGVGESGVYASGIAFDTFNIESGESTYSYKERMRIFSNGNIAIGTTTNFGYKLNVNGSTRLAGTLNVTGAITVSSSTKVNNLHVDKVDGFDFWSGSKSAYDAITTKSSTTIYIIT